MASYKKRNNRKFDIDARGVRTSWARIDRLYDGSNRLPNDSEQFGRQVLDYIASIINDVENASDAGLRSFDSDFLRTGDGYGGRNWILNEEYNPAVISAYSGLVSYLAGSADDQFFDTNGGLRPSRNKNEYNIVVTDSDGVVSTKNVYTLFKQFVPEWMNFDFFARKAIAEKVITAISEDSDLEQSITDSVQRTLNTGHGALQLPVGRESERPAGPNTGMIRYNDNFGEIEFYDSDGWQILSGLQDNDRDTYIQVENTPGADNDEIDFYTGGSLRQTIDNTGRFMYNTTVPVATYSFVGTFDIVGQTEISSLNVEDLTNNRIVIAGVDGEIEDDLNFTFDGTTFNVGVGNFTVDVSTGNVHTSGTLDVDGNTNLDGTLQVDGNTNIDGALTATSTATVTGLTTLNGGLTMDGGVFTVADGTGDVHTSGTLDVDGNTNLDGTLQVDGAANLSNNLTVAGTTTLNGNTTIGDAAADTLTVNATSDFNAGVNIDGALTLTSTLTVTGLTTLNGGLTMDGGLFTVDDGSGNVHTSGTLDVDGNTNLDGNLQVDGTTNIDGALTATSTATVTGLTTLNGGLTMDGGLFTVADGSGNVHTSGTLDVDGNTNLDGTLQVDGTTNIDGALTATSTATVTGLTTLNGGLTMDGGVFTVADGTGNVHTSGTLDVDGNTNLDGTLQVDGTTNIDGALTATSTATVTGLTTLNGGLTMDGGLFTVADGSGNVHTSGTLDVDGNTNLDGTLQVDGTTNIDGALTATSTVTVTGLTTLNGGLTMDGGLFTVADGSGNVHTSGTLDVDGNTNLDGTLRVDGNVDFNDKAGINATTGAIQTDSLAGVGQRYVTVDASGNISTADATADVGLIIYDSAGGVLKTIYAQSA